MVYTLARTASHLFYRVQRAYISIEAAVACRIVHGTTVAKTGGILPSRRVQKNLVDLMIRCHAVRRLQQSMIIARRKRRYLHNIGTIGTSSSVRRITAQKITLYNYIMQ